MKTITLISAACALAAVTLTQAFAGTVTFENPALFGKDVGNYYAGVTFSGDVVTTVSSGYPGAGSYNITDSGTVNTGGGLPEIVVQFATPQTSISFLYASLAGIQVNAYNSANTLVGSANLATTVGYGISATASSDVINAAGITTVDFIDEAGISGFEVLDNISAPGISGLPAPDATSTLGLLGLAGFGLFIFQRKFATR